MEKAMAPHSSTLAWKIHGQRSLVGCSPWGTEESDTTEWLHFHFSLSCIGEGNGNPLQCSCLENPRDEEAWWAAVYGIAQSGTRLKRLSSSNHDKRKKKNRNNILWKRTFRDQDELLATLKCVCQENNLKISKRLYLENQLECGTKIKKIYI